MLTFDQVVDRVKMLAAHSDAPLLSSAEWEECVTMSKQFDIWVAGTAYLYGQIIMPSPRNGYLYKCTLGGTAGGTAPTAWPTYKNGVVTDGTIQWTYYDTDYDEQYDVNVAAYNAWGMKAGYCAKNFDLTAGVSLSLDQTYQHCREEQKKYTSQFVL